MCVWKSNFSWKGFCSVVESRQKVLIFSPCRTQPISSELYITSLQWIDQCLSYERKKILGGEKNTTGARNANAKFADKDRFCNFDPYSHLIDLSGLWKFGLSEDLKEKSRGKTFQSLVSKTPSTVNRRFMAKIFGELFLVGTPKCSKSSFQNGLSEHHLILIKKNTEDFLSKNGKKIVLL